MIELYFYPSPNGLKVAILLEELGLQYRLVPVDITRGAQFEPQFLKLSPNNKIPALIDPTVAPPVRLFESGAILLYLAEREGRFMPQGVSARAECLAWLFWQVGGLGPMAGQAHHFRAFASENVPYGIRRYTDEVNRLYGVLDRRLADQEWIADGYSIADIACYPWIVPHERQGQDLAVFPHLRRWFDTMTARPGVQRGLACGHERAADQVGHTFLYGQTAASVDARAAQAKPTGTGGERT